MDTRYHQGVPESGRIQRKKGDPMLSSANEVSVRVFASGNCTK